MDFNEWLTSGLTSPILRLQACTLRAKRPLTIGHTISCILTLLELAFDTKSLRDLCENEEKARRELGPEVAEKLKHRLADLRAAESVKDLVVGQPREVKSADPGCFLVDLANGCRLTFCANHLKVPKLTSECVDWRR